MALLKCCELVQSKYIDFESYTFLSFTFSLNRHHLCFLSLVVHANILTLNPIFARVSHTRMCIAAIGKDKILTEFPLDGVGVYTLGFCFLSFGKYPNQSIFLDSLFFKSPTSRDVYLNFLLLCGSQAGILTFMS